MSDETKAENVYSTREVLTRSAISRASACVERVLLILTSMHGDDDRSFRQALTCAETAYLETYVSWQSEKNSKEPYRRAHEQAAAFRAKILEVKKLLDELECEGDRLLQSVHALRT